MQYQTRDMLTEPIVQTDSPIEGRENGGPPRSRGTPTAPLVQLDGPWFKDQSGRTLMFRGVNLGGSSKVPTQPEYPATLEQFYRHRDVSFVNRPFPLDEADEHFRRLRRWGLTFLRFLVTWEAIEHAGPGQYDEAYLDYLEQVVRRAAAHGFTLFIDPHQDAWSRLSGGDGAPGWTFEAAGFEISRFRPTGVAHIHPFDNAPFVVHWHTNYSRLAAATMFTLFFGGSDFAPKTTIDGEPAQDMLQRHYINAFKQVAHRLRGIPNVVGFGTMNEPSSGYIGREMHAHNKELHMRRLGISPTPYQSILMGEGYPQKVDVWGFGPKGLHVWRKQVLNRVGMRTWQDGQPCIWREHGVWDTNDQGEPRLLRPHHFTHVLRSGQPHRVDFGRDYLRPFVNTFAQEIRTEAPRALMFVENVPRLDMPQWGTDDAPGVINASHWYDVLTLVTRLFLPWLNFDIKTGRPVVGQKRVQRLFLDQLASIKRSSHERMGGVPTLLGEFGVSFNMPFRLNYRLNWFGLQEWAMDASFHAIEAHLLSATIWNYNPDNTNRLGDLWNTEDLSIFSRDQQTDHSDPDSGGRALPAVVRPYPCRTAGEPLHMAFDWRRHHFTYAFLHDPSVQEPTELFLPALHYPDGYRLEVSDGTWTIDQENQRLYYWPGQDRRVHTIRVWRAEL